jgi:hypothetical protein
MNILVIRIGFLKKFFCRVQHGAYGVNSEKRQPDEVMVYFIFLNPFI